MAPATAGFRACLCLWVVEAALPEGVPVAVSEEFQAAQKMLPAPHCVHLRLVSMSVSLPQLRSAWFLEQLTRSQYHRA